MLLLYLRTLYAGMLAAPQVTCSPKLREWMLLPYLRTECAGMVADNMYDTFLPILSRANAAATIPAHRVRRYSVWSIWSLVLTLN